MTKSSTKVRGRGKGAARERDSSAGGLQPYRNKRDPRTSNEPFAAERIDSTKAPTAPSKAGTWSGDFVVHLHQASHRHFDLRMQIANRLLSFAIPKGPSLDPREKRLAIQTEDHPFEYLDFEDVIPQGNYGAGAMIVWDIGRVNYLEHSAEEGLKKNKLDFVLSGRKLRGRFALVETGHRQKPPPKQRQWLLFKKTDAHSATDRDITEEEARSVLSGMSVEELANREMFVAQLMTEAEALGAPVREVDATRLEPMLCSLEGARLDDPRFVYELKLDGVRILADKRKDRVTLRYRKARATQSYPDIARAVRALAPAQLLLDGEIVTFDAEGRPTFQGLAGRIHAQRPHDIKRACVETPVTYLVFDLLQLGDRDLTGLPLHARKQLLAKLVPGKGLIRTLDHTTEGERLFALCAERDLEGVVAKRVDSKYRPGPQRTGDWVKIKRQRDDDFAIVGWTTGKGSRKQLGALELASFDGQRYVYRGRVGSGLDLATIARLTKEMASLSRTTSPAVGEPEQDGSERHFVEPRLVASVTYHDWTDGGHLRQPVFRGIRDDVEPEACRAAPADEQLEQELTIERAREGSVETTSSAGDWRALAGRNKLSNLDKVFWPEEGYTKGELLEYYANIAPVMLPHLAERPVMLVRYPDGIKGKSFYQWNVPPSTPDWARTLEIEHGDRDDRERRTVTTFLIGSVEELLHVINLGCIPLHVLACREGSLDECDFLTLDLDPGEQPFASAVQVALSLRELLEEIGLRGFPKTSGQAGLHVLVPLGPGVTFAAARSLTDLIGRQLQLRNADISTSERRVNERGGRLLIDTGQTGPSRTIVAPYSARAHAGATVSTPLAWEEVHRALDPNTFNIFNVPQRARDLGDPMHALLDERPDVEHAVSRLRNLFRL